MMKLMVMTLAILGSVSVQAQPGTKINYAVQDNKAVGPLVSKQTVQDQKSVSVDSQVETALLLDLNEGFEGN